MYLIFAAVRFFPYWTLPMIFIFGDLTLYFRRRGNSAQYLCGGTAAFFTLLTLLWFVFRGDLYSDSWVRSALGG